MIITSGTGLNMSSRNYFSISLLKDSTKMINPVIVTLIGAIILSTALTFFYTSPLPITPFPNPGGNSNPTGAATAVVLNALYFVVIIAIGGVLFVFLIKYGLGKLMDYLLVGVFAVSAFSFAIIILPALLVPVFNSSQFLLSLLSLFGPDNSVNFYNFIIILSIVIAILTAMGLLFVKNYYVHNTFMIIFGMSMGSIFGVFFDSLSLFGVLIALALYDIYAVFRGPLKSMFNELDLKSDREPRFSTDQPIRTDEINNTNQTFEDQQIADQGQTTTLRIPQKVKNPQMSNGMTLPVYATPYITIGLGDFAFFSVLIAKATYLAFKGDFLILPAATLGTVYWLLIVFTFIGILIGAYLTFVLLQKYEILPALPLPIALGIVGFAVALLLQIV